MICERVHKITVQEDCVDLSPMLLAPVPWGISIATAELSSA